MSHIDLKSYRGILAKIETERLRELYAEALQNCRLGDYNRPPKPRDLQELVQLWRELRKRSRSKYEPGSR